MGDPPIVTLEPATANQAPLLANLLELYIHDLSEVFPVEVGLDGRFGYPRLPTYWQAPETRFAFLIRSGTKVAGFVLATLGSSATDDPEVRDVAEFFVLRSQRRSGIGRAAAFALWAILPGPWVVRVSEANRAGLSFWGEVIREYTAGSFSEQTRPGEPTGWRIFLFTSKP